MPQQIIPAGIPRAHWWPAYHEMVAKPRNLIILFGGGAIGRSMLNLNHPMTRHVFHASGLMDGVMARGQRMSVSPSEVRAKLLAECVSLFGEMRELAVAHFGKRAAFITAAVDEYEAAIRTLAGLGDGRVTEDRRNGTGMCTVCGTAVTHDPGARIVLCVECVRPFMTAYDKLDSSEGFSTWGI